MPQELTAAAPLSLPAFCVALGCADGVGVWTKTATTGDGRRRFVAGS